MDLWLVSEASYNNGYEKGQAEFAAEVLKLLPQDLLQLVQKQYNPKTDLEFCLNAIELMTHYW